MLASKDECSVSRINCMFALIFFRNYECFFMLELDYGYVIHTFYKMCMQSL